MVQIPKFKMYNFTPRKGVADRINSKLAHLFELAPSDSGLSATIDRQGEFFTFEIVIRSSQGIFRSQLSKNIRDPICRERLWQVKVVSGMHHELMDQLEFWQSSRFAAA